MLTVGHGQTVLPVIPGEPLGGYADRSGGALGSLEPLEVHALSIHQDGRRMVIVVVDIVCVNTDLVERVRARVQDLGVSALWLSATHAHSTPEAGCFPGGASTPETLAARIVQAAHEATRHAIAGEQPAHARAVRTHVSDIGGRRNIPPALSPVVPVDALVFERLGGTREDRRLGILVVTPVHPTVLGAENRFASADLAGGVRRELAADADWVVAATGAAGDISTRTTRRGRDLAEIDRLAAGIAAALRPAVAEWAARTPGDDTLDLPIARTLSLPSNERAVPARVSSAGAPSDPFADRRQAVLDQGITLVAARRSAVEVDRHDITVEAIRLGSVRLVALPAELYLDLGERIRAEHTGGDVIVLGYTNGYLGYLPDRDAPVSYETVVSPVEHGSGEMVVQAALTQLLELESLTPVAEGTP
ncbi:hypothetical protein ACFC1I_16020 [Microbacterium sp. NPDC056044]|uniref:hypothetical protein n=1 Tax=Microbacterium sp. NPDC056044 TaxID=3345690 RepID=UPI0035DA35EA